MNILFLTLSAMENIEENGIYTDLVRELANKGMNMYVIFPRERRDNLPTELTTINNINILKIKTGNITQTNLLEKGISTLIIENQYLRAVKKYFSGVRFDLIMYSTPPITFEKVVKYLKKEHKSKTYLVLKDIFPQNAVDIEMIKKGSIIWNYFRNKEKKLYKASDMIGCMSKGNVEYILTHNPFIEKEKVEVFPNAIEPVERNSKSIVDFGIYEKYKIPIKSTLFVYGGNLGKPQGIKFLLEVIDNFHKIDNGYLLIVGSGTEYELIRKHLEDKKPNNVNLFNKLPKEDYDQLLKISDVGLIFLDKRFTIPNFPSRLISYMEYSLPILAATDKHTDLKEMLLESNSGLWSESEDIESFLENASKLASNENLRKLLGMNGREYLEEHYDIRKTVNVIMKHL